MSILMVGHSGVGKTTYMASMYHALSSSQNEHPFGLKSPDRGTHGYLRKIGESIRKGLYPLATDQRAKYDFILTHGGNDFWPFEWIDYRGGVFSERSTLSGDRAALDMDVENTEAVLLFFDCSKILEGRCAITKELSRISFWFQTVVGKLQRPIPVVMVLTKSDLVNENDINVLVEQLNPFVECANASEMIVGTLIPVSCGTQSEFVEVPVLYTLCIWTLLAQVIATAEAESLSQSAQQCLNESIPIIDTIRVIFGDGRHPGNEAQQYLEWLQQRMNLLSMLETPAKELLDMLSGLPLFGGCQLFNAEATGNTSHEHQGNCPRGHGPMKIWEGKLRCWTCGYPDR
jgi:GTPase SAR1 family protein